MIAIFGIDREYNKLVDTKPSMKSNTHRLSPKKLSVALIGLGSIGFRLGLNSNSKPNLLTHYENLIQNNKFQLIAGIDSDLNSCGKFTEQTGLMSYGSIEQLDRDVDLIVVATSTESHCSVIEKAVNLLNPSYIICEKPLGINYLEAQKIVDELDQSDTKLFVPYYRRYMPKFLELKEKISQEYLGKIVAVTVQYGQGLLTNGSHFINLVDFLTGGLQPHISNVSRASLENPSWVSYTRFGSPVHIVGIDSVLRSGEIRIVCQNGQVVINQGGSQFIEGQLDKSSGWVNAVPRIENYETRLGLSYFYEHVISSLALNHEEGDRDTMSALRTQLIISKVFES
jgi:predicted dehydrogenase